MSEDEDTIIPGDGRALVCSPPYQDEEWHCRWCRVIGWRVGDRVTPAPVLIWPVCEDDVVLVEDLAALVYSENADGAECFDSVLAAARKFGIPETALEKAVQTSFALAGPRHRP